MLLVFVAFVGLFYAFVLSVVPPAKAQSSTAPSSQSKPAAKPAQQTIVGRNCQTCHRAIVESFALEIHGKSARFLSDSRAAKCEVCHENSDEHAEKSTQSKSGAYVGNPARMTSSLANESCLQCHSRDRYLNDWKGGKHDRNDMSCLSCHSSHHTKFLEAVRASRERSLESGNPNLIDVKEPDYMLSSLTVEETCYRCHSNIRKSQYQRSTHLFRTENQVMKVNCVSCHNPHGGEGRKMLVASSTNETCYQCHAEKRGPFLWEHAPVQENCMTCHSAHGSNNVTLLTKRSHQLCQQCHINLLPRHSTVAGFDIFSFNRGCVNCHSQIHGSNHPSGRTFTR